MTVRNIASSAQDVGRNILDKGTNAVKWGGRKIGDLGGFLKTAALSIRDFVFQFLKRLNLRHHISVAWAGVKDFSQHVRDHKVYSLGIAGIAALITYGAIYLLKNPAELS